MKINIKQSLRFVGVAQIVPSLYMVFYLGSFLQVDPMAWWTIPTFAMLVVMLIASMVLTGLAWDDLL